MDFHKPRTSKSAVGFYDADSPASSSLEFNNANSHEASSLGRSNSCASSLLGPSDSASQSAASQSVDPATERALEVKRLLQLVEAPSARPSCLDPSVLWRQEDCETDKLHGDIVTEANKNRPKMHLTLRREDGSLLSTNEFNNVQISADLLATRLMELATQQNQNPGSKRPTKLNIKKWFKTDYHQAILELEAEQKYLRLCSAHWKADNMIGQAFLRQSDAQRRRRNRETASMPGSYNEGDPAPAPIPASSVVPINAAKRAFELSPGPKSPSALQAQKRSKDETKKSEPKNKDPLVAPSNRKCSLQFNPLTNSSHIHMFTESRRPVARRLAPTFINQAVAIEEEHALSNRHNVSVAPVPMEVLAPSNLHAISPVLGAPTSHFH